MWQQPKQNAEYKRYCIASFVILRQSLNYSKIADVIILPSNVVAQCANSTIAISIQFLDKESKEQCSQLLSKEKSLMAVLKVAELGTLVDLHVCVYK